MLRKFSTKSSLINYYTTPIYYVNADPHIGHLYSSLIADAAQRWRRMSDRSAPIEFSTGTDEHGTKIQQAASKFSKSPANYCDEISSKYRKLSDQFGVSYTRFIRTTDEEHKETVNKFWDALKKNNLIYRAAYEGWYCVSDECFLTESQLKESTVDGRKVIVSGESGHPVEWTQEQNYIFKLGSFRDDLLYWLKQNDFIIRPQKFQKILINQISNEDLPDVSVSRPSSRVSWGIKVPEDDSQTVYVWLDALVNYLTVAGYANKTEQDFNKVWPPDVQVIGKDILKFHGIYWPAFLMGANLEPPRSILCHSHWTVDGEKMSKSKRNVVCPFVQAEKHTSDGLRYFLLREGVAHSDGNFSETKLTRILNSELADTLGNLLNRCTALSLNPNQILPEIEIDSFESISKLDVTKKLIDHVTSLPETCQQHYEDLNFYKVVDSVVATLHSANLFFETLKPWQLKKDPTTLNDLNVVLHITMETLRVSAVLLQPIIPNITDMLLNKINVPKDERYFDNLRLFSWSNREFRERNLSSEKAVLFQRIISEEADNKKKQKRKT
ncbi:unnamed protein product [Brassicogethes aeneus]|uniref:Methionine--tRNA ligase, mitochondrial n=1 Tax=Brassicogethes aeneus TaxID=1431903 RepID=A0A9P0FH59_BRAAE|nr:unnamed protein product [Brassicogethes aeneus]